MTIEVGILIALIGCGVGLAGWMRNTRADSQKDAADMTTVIVKLENISASITEIKTELGGMQSEVKAQRDRLIVAEQSLKSAWKRIETLETATQG